MRHGSIALALGAAVLLGCDEDKNGDPAPPAHDITGTWDVYYEYGGPEYGPYTAILYMEEAGNVTGTYDGDPVTGQVSGYNVRLTVDQGSNTISINATLDAAGTGATGTWSDSYGNSGGWRAVKR